MKSLRISLAAALSVAAILVATSCQSPTSSSSPTTTTVTDTSKIGFEAGYTVSGVTANESDVKGGTMGMTFTLSTAQKNTGAQSLECQGTSQQNAYSTDFFGEASIPVPSAPVDFTGKSITVAIYVPTGSEVSAVNLTLIDSNGKQTLLQQQNTTPGKWATLTFTPVTANINYQDTGALITSTNTLRLRFETTNSAGTAASAPVDAFVDSINW